MVCAHTLTFNSASMSLSEMLALGATARSSVEGLLLAGAGKPTGVAGESSRLHADASGGRGRMANHDRRSRERHARGIRVQMLGMLRSRLRSRRRQRRTGRLDRRREAQPVLSRRLPRDGRPGPGRRELAGLEGPRRSGNGRLAKRRPGVVRLEAKSMRTKSSSCLYAGGSAYPRATLPTPSDRRPS
jgi:hypothetical protein